MKIGIIGHGHVGKALAGRWLAAGHQVIFGVRHKQDSGTQDLSHEISGADVLSIENVASAVKVILIATPAHVAVEVAQKLGDLAGKTVIDATNALKQRPEPYKNTFEVFREITGADMAKCFNTTGYENLANPNYGSTTVDMFVAGSSTKAKEEASALARDAGFENVYDFGGDDKVEAIEALAFAWINLAVMQSQGRNIAFKVLKR